MTKKQFEAKTAELNKMIDSYNETALQFHRSRNQSYRDALDKILLEKSSNIQKLQAELMAAIIGMQTSQQEEDPADWWKNPNHPRDDD